MYKTILTFIISLSSLAFAQMPTANLSAYYPFNGNANDSTGNHFNDGKMYVTNATVFIPDRTGKGLACNFDGINDYIIIPNRSSFNMPRDSATVIAWYNTNVCTKSSLEPQCIWDTYGRGNAGKTRELSLSVTALNDSSGKQFQLLEAIATTSNNTDTELLVLPFAVQSPGWHNTAIKWEKPILSFYVDGALVGTKTATIPDAKLSTNDKTTYIGSDVFTATKCFCGLIDDIRLYNRGLSAPEIVLLSQEGGSRIISRPNPHNGSHFNIVIQNPRLHFPKAIIISCAVSSWPPVSIGIFTLDGRLVGNLSLEKEESTTATIIWDGITSNGTAVRSGAYVVKISSADGRNVTAHIVPIQ